MENEFNAITYDINVEHFIANVSIYGFKNFGQRSELTYKKIVELRKYAVGAVIIRNIQLLVANERMID